MAELIGQGPVGLVGPCSVETYAGGSEACISLVSLGGWAYCSADGGVRRLELEFKGLEPHGGWVREVYRPKKRSIFARTKEYGYCEARRRASGGLGVRGPAGSKRPLPLPSLSPAGLNARLLCQDRNAAP